MKIHKGDNVQIMAGKDSGKRGKVLKVNPDSGKIIVEGLNLFKKHQRPRKQGEKGEITAISKPIQVSNAMLVCGSCGEPAKVGYKIAEDGIKSRYCKKCQAGQ